MDTDDIMLHLFIVKFVDKLFKNERLEFSLILQILQKKTKRDDKKNKDNTNYDDTRSFHFETTNQLSYSAIRNIYTVGTHSIVQNLPRPKVQMIDGHSYVSIKQCILYILGCGKMPQKISVNRYSKIHNISES